MVVSRGFLMTGIILGATLDIFFSVDIGTGTYLGLLVLSFFVEEV